MSLALFSFSAGDHAYKQTKDMSATEQMITALPDVKTLRINPKQDDFMILACDGIWNFMSSQDVVDFVRTRLVEKKMKPVKICEEVSLLLSVKLARNECQKYLSALKRTAVR